MQRSLFQQQTCTVFHHQSSSLALFKLQCLVLHAAYIATFDNLRLYMAHCPELSPHNFQAFGDWSEEEHKLFVITAEKHGVGDKWGLFASYIPQRVGYQCSAYYRDVIIPACLVLDARFRLSPQGKAIFMG